MMSSKRYTIPAKNRSEWVDIVTAQVRHRFSNYVLQMKSAEYQRKIEQGSITVDDAIEEMHQLCEKYALAVQDDFKHIFKEW